MSADRARVVAELVEESADALCAVSPAGEILYWNRAAERVFGYARQEALGKLAHELIGARYLDSLSARVVKDAAGVPEFLVLCHHDAGPAAVGGKMAHDLRAPLNAIIGFASIMRSGKTGPLSDEHKEYLGDILASAERLLQVIRNIVHPRAHRTKSSSYWTVLDKKPS